MPPGNPARTPPASPRPPRHTPRGVRGLVALAAGALPALAFPAPALWWLAYAALVPWLLLVRSAPTGRRAAWDGWLGGVGFLLAVHHWLLPVLHGFIVLVAIGLGALWAPWGWLAHRLLGPGSAGGRRASAALVLLPCGWLMVELVRSWQYLGGPWGLLGASQWQVAPVLRLVSLGGVWLASLLVVAVNTALVVLLVLPRARRAAVVGLVGCATGVAGVWAWSPAPQAAGTVRVALVQPGMIDGGGPRFDREETLTRELAGRGVSLVVWGESSVGGDLVERPDLRQRLATLSRQVGAELLVNVDAKRPGQPGVYKSSVLVGPRGPIGERYDKMRLVPFGEYVPARSLLGWSTSVGQAAEVDRRRGARSVVMRVPDTRRARLPARRPAGAGTAPAPASAAGLRLGPLVCFESAFPDMSRRLVRNGAQLLVAQAATASFQHSWAPAQHASLAALRAAETWRPTAHATLTGTSAVFGPRGAPVGGRLDTRRSAAAVYDVPLADGTSPYVRFGDWPLYGAIATLLVAGAVAGGRARRRRAEAGRRLDPRQRPRRDADSADSPVGS
ncbi:apolipoprotein N-acyltransferase [Streptomyces sp. NPDC057702]|uniref:apolipoprotein N-acyltransferase n=1 Tax=unclassified Streptomyces TaxID=2593676 RepID=UPI003697F68E